MDKLERIKQIFETESSELLQEVEQEVLKLESNPDSTEPVKQIFRNIHSIKGTAGMFGLADTEYFMHEFEDMLDVLRAGEVALDSDHIDIILKAVDHVKVLIGYGDKKIPKKLKDTSESLIKTLQTLAGKELTPQKPTKPKSQKISKLFWNISVAFRKSMKEGEDLYIISQLQSMPDAEITFVPEKIPTLKQHNSNKIFGSWIFRIPQDVIGKEELETIFDFSNHCDYEIEASASPVEKNEDFKSQSEDPQKARATESEDLDVIFEDDDNSDVEILEDDPFEEDEAEHVEVEEFTEIQDNEEVAAKEETTIRVRLELLENLMNRVSELVLNRNQLLQFSRKNHDGLLNKYVMQLDKLTSEIQETAMNTRMEPVGNSWVRLPRIVRDLSRELDKDIKLELRGESTELDRQIMQKLNEPLVHLLRNSIDHGIESASERKKAGKPETGTVRLNAYSSAGNIFIEVKDDGKGLNPEKIRDKAISSGLITKEEATQIPDKEILEYIFKPGFSTAGKVSKISGRGVGLDVVKRNIESVGGQIITETVEGVSSTFTIKIPLTLAVISALTFVSGSVKFAISEMSVAELVWLNEDNKDALREVNGQQVLKLRNQLIPLVNMNKLLELNELENEDKYIVVIEDTAFTYGLIVDTVDEIQEIVVKPLSRTLQHIQAYSGCTIVGSEEIVLILDANGIREMAGLDKNADLNASISDDDTQEKIDTTRLLLFENRGGQKAVPLDLVARLEEFSREKIEQIDEDYVIQYRDHVLPLIPFHANTMKTLGDIIPVLVLQDEGFSAGVIVEKFLDIIDTNIKGGSMSRKNGVVSVEIIEGRTTEIVDLNWFYQRIRRISLARTVTQSKNISNCIVIERSQFIRNHLLHILESIGFKVHAVRNADELPDLLNSNAHYAMVMMGANESDIKKSLVALESSDHKALLKVLVGAENVKSQIASHFDMIIEDFDKNEILKKIAGLAEETSEF